MFDIQVKDNKEILFTINKEKHKIPSKIYPLSKKKDICIFTINNTIDIPEDDYCIQRVYNEIKPEVGRCYTNSDNIYKLGFAERLLLEFYSGWLFFGGSYPIHHSWIIYNKKHLLDLSIFKNNDLIESRCMELKKNGESQEKIREEFAYLFKKERNKMIPNHKKYIYGKCSNQCIYVGTIDDKENAINIFNRLINQFNPHPSYRGNMNQFGMSDIQAKTLR